MSSSTFPTPMLMRRPPATRSSASRNRPVRAPRARSSRTAMWLDLYGLSSVSLHERNRSPDPVTVTEIWERFVTNLR